uniref:Uncharacterized protein n=1 Tax=Kalanchoe fedtschenkoi TaxID=63787 RepID=A0A7N0TIU2_KALFE
MDKCLDWPALTEGESSERPKMRVNKLVDIEQIYKVTPICTIKDVERMSRDTQAPETDSNMQKSCEEPSNKGKCKNDRRLSGDMKVQICQDLSQSNIAKRVPETDEGKNKNDAGATALKRTSTKNQRPASSFPHQKPEEHPTAGKTGHSSKATTKEVKCKNHLTQNEVANGTKNEERCFRRLRKSISSEKTRPSVEGGNQAVCDLQDSENSLSENVEVSETDEEKNKNEVGATALKSTSTKNQRPASVFPHQKLEEHPTSGKTCHSSKATTKEVKCKNHLTQNEVANGTKNERCRCFQRLRKSISSGKNKPSENQIDVEGGNQAACDLQDSENSLSENVEVSETNEEKNKNEVGATALKSTSTKNQRPASSFPHQKPEEHPTAGKTCHSSKATTKEVKCKNHLTQNEVANEIKNEDRCFQRLRKSISSGKTKPSENQVDVEGGNQAACDLQYSEDSLYTMRDGKFSSQLCKKRSSWRSDFQSGKFPKNMTPNIPLSGYHEEARGQEFRFSSSGAEHKNCWKNVSYQDIASMEAGAEIVRCLEDDRKSSRVADKEKLRSRDEMVSVKQKKIRLGEEGNMRLRNKRVPPRDDDQNPRFSLLEVSHKKKDVKLTRNVSKSTTTENNNGEISDSLLAVGRHGIFSIEGVDHVAMAEFEAHNWKSSPSLFISQPASSNSLLQIRGRTSLTARHADVYRDQLHHEYHWPLSAISPNSTSAAMLEKFELQKIEGGVSKAFCSNPQESQVFARLNTTFSGDKRQLSLMAKNSIHDISQAKSHAASTSRLRLFGKDIILEDTNMTTANTHGYSHNISTHNTFGHKSSGGISIPSVSVAGPLKSVSSSRLNDNMALLPPPLLHNDSGSSHRPTPHETVLLNNNYHGASGHPPPELAAAYLNNFSQSAFPSVPDDHWRHVNPNYFHHQAAQQGMTAFTSYAPPNGQAIRSNNDPRPLISSSPAARTSFVLSSSSAPTSSKHARRRRN